MRIGKTKQIENCILGLCLMDEIPPEKVDLDDWTKLNSCRSVHCFGGWVAVTDAFREQGVRADLSGSPYMVDDKGNHEYGSLGSLGVAEALFGDFAMFCIRGSHRLDDERLAGNDRDVVVNRLEAQIVKLSSR